MHKLQTSKWQECKDTQNVLRDLSAQKLGKTEMGNNEIITNKYRWIILGVCLFIDLVANQNVVGLTDLFIANPLITMIYFNCVPQLKKKKKKH